MSELDSISAEDFIPVPEKPIDMHSYVRHWVNNIDPTSDPYYSSDVDDVDDLYLDLYLINVSFYLYINN